MQKQKTTIQKILSNTRALVIAGLVLAVSGSGVAVHASTLQDQINALNGENAAVQNNISVLAGQAASYQEQIAQLEAQIAGIRAQIAASKAKQAELQSRIEQNQAEINLRKSQLAADVKAMYMDGNMSSVELFASSSSISEVVDKEEYRAAVQAKLNTTIKTITELQEQLNREKIELETLLASQQQQNNQLAGAQSELSSMLAYNEGQRAAFNSQIASNSSKIAELRRQQAIENARYNVSRMVGSAGNGGYPDRWHNAPMDSIVDTWGMYNRECVSFTAWKVHQDFLAGKNAYDMPYWGGVGNANQWDDNAEAAGIPVDYTPKPGSIGVSNSGKYGHVVYVEKVNGDQIYISQYNAQWDGEYSEGWRTTAGLVFIHFEK